jgi:hypothetical protein
MKRLLLSSSRAISRAVLGTLILLEFCCHPAFLNSSPQSDHPRQNLHSVLSQSVLTPALPTPEVTLRFSPNGKYLLFQDASRVAVLSTTPLRVVFHVEASDIYPARFTADSGSITMVSRGLSFVTWKLPAGQKIASGDLPLRDGCLDGQLSPGGQFFACVAPDLKFMLVAISTQKSIFEESLDGAAHLPSGRFQSSIGHSFVSFISLDTDSPFARPFGIVRMSSPRTSPGRILSSSSIYFTSDAKVLLVNSYRGAFGLDLTAGKRFDVSDRFQKIMPGAIALQNADRAVVVEKDKEKESKSFILALRNGKILASPQFTADRLRMASNPRYLLLHNFESGSPSAGAFDLSETRLLDVPPNVSMDVFEDLMAIYNSSGFVVLYRMGDRQLLSNLHLSFSALPVLSAASVTPDLDQLALSVSGAGAIFRLSSGQRLASYPKFSAANFLDQQNATLLLVSAHHDPPRVVHATVSSGETSPGWEIPKDGVLHSNGPVLLEYSLKKEGMSRWDFEMPEAQIPFRLRARDPATGKELWKRDFEDHPPTPFADPQGERLVLGWRAKSSEAKAAAARNPAANLIYKNAKLTDQDSFFEALDARTGKSPGGILVQVGSSATSFDSAFSVGDAMVLIKDGVRVSLYSLVDGQLKTHLVGVTPSVSTESKLLALDLGSGRLGIYDSNSGVKLDQQFFPDEIAYAHFSSDGKRLFVLTEHQSAVILDVSKVREAHPESPAPTPENN